MPLNKLNPQYKRVYVNVNFDTRVVSIVEGNQERQTLEAGDMGIFDFSITFDLPSGPQREKCGVLTIYCESAEHVSPYRASILKRLKTFLGFSNV